jgi:hypothetical protein
MTFLQLFAGVLLLVWAAVLAVWEVRAAQIDCPAWTHLLRTVCITLFVSGALTLLTRAP